MTSKMKTLGYAFAITAIGLFIIISPKDTLSAAIKGLHIWGTVVFPSLFPFFVVAEIMILFGVVNFIGVLLEPFMRPLFRVPGVGGFVLSMGVASGFPAGAKFTARLRQERQLTAIEAERLVSFTNSSNPLFMGGAVAVGFFNNASLALLIMASHYLGNLLVGLTMRFHGRKQDNVQKVTPSPLSWKQAFREMHTRRLSNRRTLGEILGEAVQSSIQTLLMIGGFIILFSVLHHVFSIVHVTKAFQWILGLLLFTFSIPAELGGPLFSGLLEITNGIQLVSLTEDIPIFYQLIIVSFILGFNGLSIHAQVASFLAEAKIRFWPYFTARILHGIYAVFFTILLWGPLNERYSFTEIAVVSQAEKSVQISWLTGGWTFLNHYGAMMTIIILTLFMFTKRTSQFQKGSHKTN